jgi:hypothetical protein
MIASNVYGQLAIMITAAHESSLELAPLNYSASCEDAVTGALALYGLDQA